MMKSVEYILGIRIRAATVASSAESVVDLATKQELSLACTSLREVADRFSGVSAQLPEVSNDVVKQFYVAAKKGPRPVEVAFSSRKKRENLARSLDVSTSKPSNPPIVDGPYFELALKMLFRHWSHSFVAPLLCLLLRNWNSLPSVRRKYIAHILCEKVKAYSGNRSIVNRASYHSEFLFFEDGPQKLGSLCYEQEQLPSEAMSSLGFPESWSGLQYCDDVLLGYTKAFTRSKAHFELLKALLAEIEERNGDSASLASDLTKRCLVGLLLWADSKEHEDIRQAISKTAVDLIGDPDSEIDWSPWDNATESELKQVEQAKNILRALISAHFIDLFFKQTAHDPRRSAFWSSYYKNVPFVKIFCSEDVLDSILRKSPEVKDVLSNRIGILMGFQGAAAIVMRVKDYYLIEFSKTGNSFYALRATRKMDEKIRQGTIGIQTLKPPSTPIISKSSFTHCPQGRVVHHDAWEELVRRWLAFHLGI